MLPLTEFSHSRSSTGEVDENDSSFSEVQATEDATSEGAGIGLADASQSNVLRGGNAFKDNGQNLPVTCIATTRSQKEECGKHEPSNGENEVSKDIRHENSMVRSGEARDQSEKRMVLDESISSRRGKADAKAEESYAPRNEGKADEDSMSKAVESVGLSLTDVLPKKGAVGDQERDVPDGIDEPIEPSSVAVDDGDQSRRSEHEMDTGSRTEKVENGEINESCTSREESNLVEEVPIRGDGIAKLIDLSSASVVQEEGAIRDQEHESPDESDKSGLVAAASEGNNDCEEGGLETDTPSVPGKFDEVETGKLPDHKEEREFQDDGLTRKGGIVESVSLSAAYVSQETSAIHDGGKKVLDESVKSSSLAEASESADRCKQNEHRCKQNEHDIYLKKLEEALQHAQADAVQAEKGKRDVERKSLKLRKQVDRGQQVIRRLNEDLERMRQQAIDESRILEAMKEKRFAALRYYQEEKISRERERTAAKDEIARYRSELKVLKSRLKAAEKKECEHRETKTVLRSMERRIEELETLLQQEREKSLEKEKVPSPKKVICDGEEFTDDDFLAGEVRSLGISNQTPNISLAWWCADVNDALQRKSCLVRIRASRSADSSTKNIACSQVSTINTACTVEEEKQAADLLIETLRKQLAQSSMACEELLDTVKEQEALIDELQREK